MGHGLTYQETLNIVEKFMIDSGIRRYCTEICKGQCCMECYTDNPKSCRHCEGRRLPCSIYTCWELRQRFSKKIKEILSETKHSIHNQYYKSNFMANIYFEPADKTFVETAKFPISIKKDLEKIDIEEIRKTMTNLIMMEIVIYDL